MRAGWAPAALVAATSVFFVAQSSATRWRRRASAARNQELNEFSRGFSAAREMVVRYLRRQAQEAGASGIVGVRLQHVITRRTVKVAIYSGRQRTGLSVTTLGMGGDVPREGRAKRDGLAITIHAVGTAIRRQPSGSPLAPKTAVRLGERA